MIREFTCRDCGVAAVSVSGDRDSANDNPPELCGPCAWLRTIDDPAERARIRALTHRRDMS